MTTGITDVEWLDAQVCKLSDENARLRAALKPFAEAVDNPGGEIVADPVQDQRAYWNAYQAFTGEQSAGPKNGD